MQSTLLQDDLPSGVEGIRLRRQVRRHGCHPEGRHVVGVGQGNAPYLIHMTLARPEKRNAISLAMWRALPSLLQRLAADDALRGLLLSGEGEHFSAGADISEFEQVRADAEQARAYEEAVDAGCDALFDFPRPTIAALRGFCMGGACHVAMSCDLRIAAPDAVFAIPAARLSIVYGVSATRKLMSLVGVSNAKRILYSAARFDAAEALRIGFVNELADDPLAAAGTLMDTLAANAPLSIAGAKVLLNGLVSGSGALDPLQADAVIDGAVSSADYRESVRAFRAKRAPRFEGR